jgi:hypothetical protein
MGHLTCNGELRMHTKFLSENLKRGEVLGDLDIDFEDESEQTFQKCVVMVRRDSGG